MILKLFTPKHSVPLRIGFNPTIVSSLSRQSDVFIQISNEEDEDWYELIRCGHLFEWMPKPGSPADRRVYKDTLL